MVLLLSRTSNFSVEFAEVIAQNGFSFGGNNSGY